MCGQIKKTKKIIGILPFTFLLLEPFKIYEGSKIEKIRSSYNV